MRTTLAIRFLLGLAAVGVPALAAAQQARPLDKVELVRLLTNPLFSQGEVADVVRRSCLSFRPTERDWSDLRSLGAGGDVIASVAGCAPRGGTTLGGGGAGGGGSAPAPPAASPPAPAAPLTAVPVPGELVVPAGTAPSLRVFVRRGSTPQGRVPLVLRGTAALGLERDAAAVSDDSGFALFRLPPVAMATTHRFEIVTGSGAPLPGRPAVVLVVRAGRPGLLTVQPDYIDFDGTGDTTATIVAVVRDSLGNRLPAEPVELTSGIGSPLTALTDSLGRVTFLVTAAALRHGGPLQVRARGLPAASVEVALNTGLSGIATGFVSSGPRRGIAGTRLAESLVFEARMTRGGPAAGRLIRFRAVNARITADSAVTDSAGRAHVDVILGERKGEAVVFATVDSVEKLATLHVDPGPIAALILERNGVRVNGGLVVVPVAVPFTMQLTAQDFYGNGTPVTALGRMLRDAQAQFAARQRNLELVSLQQTDSVVVLTLKAQRLGSYDFTIGSGFTASVRVEAVPARQ